MSERDTYEPGVPCWVGTMQPDPEAATGFYGSVFGWQFRQADGHLVAQVRGRDVAGITPLPPGREPAPAPAWITQVSVASADETAERVRAAGGSVLAGPFDWPLGRMYVIADPAGAVLNAWEPRERKGVQLVNEPGAWAMSSLQTPDVEGAKAFYGAVFGWTTETFEVGDIKAHLFRLPGYVGGEPEQPVSREVVAAMAEAPAGTRAQWMVDFWVDDVDAAVAAAEDSSGKALAPAVDTPIARTAVLADPAGVPFSISKVNAHR